MVEIGGIGLLAALAAGAVSFLSPCVLPLVPGYLSAVTGVAAADLDSSDWRRVVPPSLAFIASFSTIFIILGVAAAEVYDFFDVSPRSLDRIAGALIILLGVFFVATIFIDRLNAEWRVDALMERAGNGGPIVAGAAFAVAWTPCAGPTLGAILNLAGVSGSSLQAAVMLGVYSLGLAVPFLLTAIAFTRMTSAFDAVKRHYRAIMAFGGAVLVVMGVLVFTGEIVRINVEAQQFLDDLGINFFNEI